MILESIASAALGGGLKLAQNAFNSRAQRKNMEIEYKLNQLHSKNDALTRIHELELAKLAVEKSDKERSSKDNRVVLEADSNTLLAAINAESKVEGLNWLRASVRPLITFALVGYLLFQGEIALETVEGLAVMAVSFWFGSRGVR